MAGVEEGKEEKAWEPPEKKRGRCLSYRPLSAPGTLSFRCHHLRSSPSPLRIHYTTALIMASQAIDRRDEDGMFIHELFLSLYPQANPNRGLPRLQVFAVSQPEHALPHQPRMLP